MNMLELDAAIDAYIDSKTSDNLGRYFVQNHGFSCGCGHINRRGCLIRMSDDDAHAALIDIVKDLN